MEIQTDHLRTDTTVSLARDSIQASRLSQRLSELGNAPDHDLFNSIAATKQLVHANNSVPISMRSRVNEQELFVAIVSNTLRRLGKRFDQAFVTALRTFSEGTNGSPHYALKLGRRSLRQLVSDGTLPQKVAREIRRIALGKAQLDADRETLKTARAAGDLETPLRAISTALNLYQSNAAASPQEHKAFKHFVSSEVRSG